MTAKKNWWQRKKVRDSEKRSWQRKKVMTAKISLQWIWSRHQKLFFAVRNLFSLSPAFFRCQALIFAVNHMTYVLTLLANVFKNSLAYAYSYLKVTIFSKPHFRSNRKCWKVKNENFSWVQWPMRGRPRTSHQLDCENNQSKRALQSIKIVFSVKVIF